MIEWHTHTQKVSVIPNSFIFDNGFAERFEVTADLFTK